jgi:hypothetical protein
MSPANEPSTRGLPADAGDLFSVNWDDDGTFRIAKVLVAGVHARVYAERFDERPTRRPEKLSLGTVHD